MLLSPATWDFMTDANGNIALASEPWALSQDAASALKLFKGELLYNVNKGIPYFQDVLGQSPPASLIKKYWVDAVLTVPGIVAATVTNIAVKDRVLTGNIRFTNANGVSNNVRL